jgi:hypothetical protein
MLPYCFLARALHACEAVAAAAAAAAAAGH